MKLLNYEIRVQPLSNAWDNTWNVTASHGMYQIANNTWNKIRSKIRYPVGDKVWDEISGQILLQLDKKEPL